MDKISKEVRNRNMAAIKGKEFLIKTVDDGIYSKKIPLREAAEAFLEGAFYQMSDHKRRWIK